MTTLDPIATATLSTTPASAAQASTPRLPLHTLRRRFLAGTCWTIAGHATSQLVRLAGNLVLVRLLLPEHFGLMLAVNVFLQGLQMFSDIGIGPAIIQHPRGDQPAFVRTAWTLQILRGFGLWFVALLLAVPYAAFCGKPQLAHIIPVAALTAVLAGFNSTSLFRLNRSVRLAAITLLDVSTQVIGLAAMIALAAGFGWRSVWVLVAGSLLGSLTRLIWSHALARTRPDRFGFDPLAARDLIRFGRWIFLGTIITFLAGQVDRLLPARLLEADRLGIFAIGLALAIVVPESFKAIGSRVLFPVLAAMARQGPDILRQRSVHLRLALLGPGVAALLTVAAVADPLIALLYPPAYADAAQTLRILSLGATATIVLFTYNNLFFAIGATHLSTLVLVAQFALALAGAITGWLHWGEPGLLAGLALAPWATYPLTALLAIRRRLWQPHVDAPVLGIAAAGAIAILAWSGLL